MMHEMMGRIQVNMKTRNLLQELDLYKNLPP